MDGAQNPDFLHVSPGGISLRVQVSIYGEEGIAQAVHRFTDRCYVHLEREGDSLICRLLPKDERGDMRLVAGDLANEMLDQMLRHRLKEETEPTRRLIVAQAFSRTNVLHPELDTDDPFMTGSNAIEPDPPFRGPSRA